VSGALGWFAREMYLAVQKLKDDLHNFRVEVAKDYTPRSEMTVMKEEIMTALHRIEDKITGK
jgi:hypothetical protein